jgi:hypothetical protein
MKLVRRYLEFVRELSPRYWVMENVPALLPDLLERMNGVEFVDGEVRVKIPERRILDASMFATPQSRRRLFSGSFPPPTPTTGESTERIPLRTILAHLPDPAETAGAVPGSISDPIYRGLKLPRGSLRDHFEDVRWHLSDSEAASTKDRRYHDRIYGVMPFPDDLDKPARTVTATRTRGSRATVVIPYRGKRHRTLTVRECASAQGFPITFQFWADSMSGKDFLVGNAVPPPVARAIANSISVAEGVRVPDSPVIAPLEDVPDPLEYHRSAGKRFSLRRRFRGPVLIDWRRDHRVELDNELPVVRASLPPDVMPPITWRTRVYLGYATLYKCYELRLSDALTLGQAIVQNPKPAVGNAELSRALLSVVRTGLNGFAADGIAVQSEWAGWASNRFGPRRILSIVAGEVGRAFPAVDWDGKTLPLTATSATLESSVQAKGTEAGPEQPLEMSVRLAVSAISLSILCEKLNKGDSPLEKVMAALVTSKGLLSPRLDALKQANERTAGRGGRQMALLLRSNRSR